MPQQCVIAKPNFTSTGVERLDSHRSVTDSWLQVSARSTSQWVYEVKTVISKVEGLGQSAVADSIRLSATHGDPATQEDLSSMSSCGAESQLHDFEIH